MTELQKLIAEAKTERVIRGIHAAYYFCQRAYYDYNFWEKEQWDEIENAEQAALKQLSKLLAIVERQTEALNKLIPLLPSHTLELEQLNACTRCIVNEAQADVERICKEGK